MNPQELRIYEQLLQNFYGIEILPGAGQLSVIKAGVENTNLIVKSGQNPFVFRIYNLSHSIRGQRDKESIELEFDFSKQAQEQGIPTPQVIPNNNGERVTIFQFEGNQRYAALFPFVEGSSRDNYTPLRSQELGRIVNKFYLAGGAFKNISTSKNFDIITRASEMNTFLQENKESFSDSFTQLESIYQRIQAELDTIQLDSLTRGLVHGDLKLENIFFDANDLIIAVLDFDDCRYSYLLEEATMALMHNLHSKTENVIRSGNYEVFIQELTNTELAEELRYLPTFILARLFYDLCKQVKKGNALLVSEILQDHEIQRVILHNAF